MSLEQAVAEALGHKITLEGPSTPTPAKAESQPSPNPLTEREVEILRLLDSGFSTREVSQHLFLSVGTVRWYLNQIYSKLHVHSRMQALIRARDLELLV